VNLTSKAPPGSSIRAARHCHCVYGRLLYRKTNDVNDRRAQNAMARTDLPLPFKSSLACSRQRCWDGQSMRAGVNRVWGVFLCTPCTPVKLTSRAP
jgi:hypothetical protein